MSARMCTWIVDAFRSETWYDNKKIILTLSKKKNSLFPFSGGCLSVCAKKGPSQFWTCGDGQTVPIMCTILTRIDASAFPLYFVSSSTT
jgi:hypothetical protein